MEIPSSFYVIAGTLIVANLGTVLSVFYGIGKAVWWAAQVDSKIKDHTEDIDAAHKFIREIKQQTKGV